MEAYTVVRQHGRPPVGDSSEDHSGGRCVYRHLSALPQGSRCLAQKTCYQKKLRSRLDELYGDRAEQWKKKKAGVRTEDDWNPRKSVPLAWHVKVLTRDFDLIEILVDLDPKSNIVKFAFSHLGEASGSTERKTVCEVQTGQDTDYWETI